MADWLDRLTLNKAKSADKAKEPLKLVLIHDRTDLSPKELDALKNELLDVVSRYIEIDPAGVHITVKQDGREQRLVANVPLKVTARRRIG